MERALNDRFYERRHVVRGVVTALVASAPRAPIPVIVVGPFGTAKTAMLEALCRSIGARFFEWPLDEATTPEELFGVVRTSLMLERDEIWRNPEGKLPTGEVVYLDEIFGGTSMVLKLLLPVLAKGQWFNGPGAQDLPMRLFVGSTNEVPDTLGEQRTLGALWNRFVLRYQVGYIQDPANFERMLRDAARRRAGGEADITLPVRIPAADVDAAQAAVQRVDVTPVLPALKALWDALRRKGQEVGDRRWAQTLAVIQAQAWLAGRAQAETQDLEILAHVLWEHPDEAREVRREVLGFVSPWFAELQELEEEAEELAARSEAIPGSGPLPELIEMNVKLKMVLDRIDQMRYDLLDRTGRVPAEIDEAYRRVWRYNNRVVRRTAGME